MAKDAGRVVLLVQPQDDSRDMYVEFLRHHGFVPMAVSDAALALPLAPKADVIVTGMVLPGNINGIEFIGQLKRNEHTRLIPVAVLTACAWITERERAVHAGCDVFLPKPCLPNDLLREVRRLVALSKARRVRGTPVKCDPSNDESAHHTQLTGKRTA
jgi:CheY-like chemotaxis protein